MLDILSLRHLGCRLGFLLLFGPVLPSHGDLNPDDLHQRIQSIRTDIQQLQQARQAQENHLAYLEQQIGHYSIELRRLRDQIHSLHQRRLDLERKLERHQQEFERQREQLADLARTAYILSRQSPLRFILALEKPAIISRALTYYRYLNRAHLDRMTNLRTKLENIRQLRAELAEAERRLSSLAIHRQQQLSRLTALQKERRKLLAEINDRLNDRKALLAKLQQDQQRLRRLIQATAATKPNLPDSDEQYFQKRRGRLHWPVAGRLVTRFGTRRGTGRWEGVVIRAPEGTPVRAVHPGQVIFAGWMPGYGLLLILRHDQEFMTLYAFNQSLLKQVGDQVSGGEIIATVGRSGGRSQPGLYFAIRHRGEPIDPQNWCRRTHYGKVD